LTGGVVLMGEMKKARHQFGSATHARRTATDGYARRGGADRGGGGSGETEEEAWVGRFGPNRPSGAGRLPDFPRK
jgi:hypothetical protein